MKRSEIQEYGRWGVILSLTAGAIICGITGQDEAATSLGVFAFVVYILTDN